MNELKKTFSMHYIYPYKKYLREFTSLCVKIKNNMFIYNNNKNPQINTLTTKCPIYGATKNNIRMYFDIL